MRPWPWAATAVDTRRTDRARGEGPRQRGGTRRPLTVREFEVAQLIAAGKTNAELADELSISPRTASAHVEHILAKLGVARRTEIAAWTSTITGTSSPAAAGDALRR
jgi:DNA-binding CsgD family transcriptional regulator